MKSYFVYIMASQENGTLYIGVTNNLDRRVYEHKHDLIEGFTKQYKVHKLVYYEESPSVDDAILREKQLKNWRRHWKLELINRSNPKWSDLADELNIGS
jgi:putative endonuclease